MNAKINKLQIDLKDQLNFISIELDDPIKVCEKSIEIISRSLNELKKCVQNRSFKSKEEEIKFFKEVKPQVFSKLIYYQKLFNIESKRPRSSNKSQIKYYNKNIDRLQNYFNDHLEFYHYYRRGATFLDEHYFVRGKIDIRLFPDTFSFFIDDKFSTSHDSTVATILAYDMLIVYLKTEIDKLENTNGMETIINPFQNQSRLFWTANKTDLIELIYALQSSGAINSGTADIKEMATACERLFNIDLGDYYRTYLEIRSRKTNQTKFLDKMKDSLVTRMEDADE